MMLSPWISFVMEVLIEGIIILVIYKFCISILQSFKKTTLAIPHAEQNPGGIKRMAFLFIDFLNQLVSYILLFLLLLLLPAICILLQDFFNQVICGEKNLSWFISHAPNTVSSMSNFYCAVLQQAEAFFHRLTS